MRLAFGETWGDAGRAGTERMSPTDGWRRDSALVDEHFKLARDCVDTRDDQFVLAGRGAARVNDEQGH